MCACVADKQQNTNTERRKEKGKRPNEKKKPQPHNPFTPKPLASEETGVPREAEKAGDNKTPC